SETDNSREILDRSTMADRGCAVQKLSEGKKTVIIRRPAVVEVEFNISVCSNPAVSAIELPSKKIGEHATKEDPRG
ncbi:hypothetical protein PMAYCL1PPCAC_05209, partial [Pristionchus mayeri]